MVVPGDSPREMREGEIVSSDGGAGDPYGGGGGGDLYGGGASDPYGGGAGHLYGGGGGELDLYGGEVLGCSEDDEIFLLPLTALAMEADDLR